MDESNLMSDFCDIFAAGFDQLVDLSAYSLHKKLRELFSALYPPSVSTMKRIVSPKENVRQRWTALQSMAEKANDVYRSSPLILQGCKLVALVQSCA